MTEIRISRRGFMIAAGAFTGVALLGTPAVQLANAAEDDFVGKRQKSVYNADAKIYKFRKSQDNPMIHKLYKTKNGFLHDGPCGHMSHHLLHTHYIDRSRRIMALKEKGFELNL